ncbi:MAG: class I SAM-dependent methyltransferase [Anaerolineae bacterium]|nr:class I SAM-dependent methyltransferase [Anaerolineae bacterium]
MTDQKVREAASSPQQREALPQSLYTEEYFLTACEGYDEFKSSDGDNLSRRLKAAFELANVEAGMTVLDVGCGRGEILRHCAKLGANSYGVDYAVVAVQMSRDIIEGTMAAAGKTGVAQSDAKKLPFASGSFDRVLMFDVVEHLHPWELNEALKEVYRVLKPDGKFIIHTAPNVWYDRFAYPLVRTFRTLLGQGDKYPANPRAFLVDVNQDVHVNEQSLWSMGRFLNGAGFKSKVWLDSPPQGRQNPWVIDLLRGAVFRVPPFRWFFEREVFAVAWKAKV